MQRRTFLSFSAAIPALQAADVPVRAITRGPGFHWFGYYDKLQFDPKSRLVLGMRVEFEGRSPKADDRIRLGVIDTGDGDRWRDLGSTSAWNWQQGAMLQWIPGSPDEVIWNDRAESDFVAHIANVRTGKRRTIPSAVYALSPDGRWAITTDFRRLNDVRPGYGYAGIADPNRDRALPEDAGIWRVDLATGKKTLLISVAQAAAIQPYKGGEPKDAKHWFNHLLVSPDGKRFIFLHRWRGPEQGTSFATRMFTANADGSEPYVLDPYGKTSHFVWRDPAHVIAWAWHPSHQQRFYLYRDRTEDVKVIGKDVMTVNGHCTYLPGNRWILNDTYPDKDRNQNVFLYDTKTGARHELGGFHSPAEYTGEWRCDTHPRFSPDGHKVCIDSPHAGGRQMYLLDISSIVG
jgi:hypothetical protein